MYLIRGWTPDGKWIEMPVELVGEGAWVESHADLAAWVEGSARMALEAAGHDPTAIDWTLTTLEGDPWWGDPRYGPRAHGPFPEAAHEPAHWDAPDFKASGYAY